MIMCEPQDPPVSERKLQVLFSLLDIVCKTSITSHIGIKSKSMITSTGKCKELNYVIRSPACIAKIRTRLRRRKERHPPFGTAQLGQ